MKGGRYKEKEGRKRRRVGRKGGRKGRKKYRRWGGTRKMSRKAGNEIHVFLWVSSLREYNCYQLSFQMDCK